jgi:hypothetical protein
MRNTALFLGIAAAMLASCTVKEEIPTPVAEDVKFYATFEQPEETATKVYVNDELCLRWNADDRVSIFNKITYNQQYKFLGQTGANAGEFAKVENAEFVTGNPIEHVVSFYPYSAETVINESEQVQMVWPSEQTFQYYSFGLNANPMLSVTYDNVLQYMNIGGYLTISLYGEGSVNSIVLEGHQNEQISGQGMVYMTSEGTPEVYLIYDPSTPSQIVLNCESPVALHSSESNAVEFWLVVPPKSFRKGFTITVNTTVGTFMKATTKEITIERNRISRMAPMKIEVVTSPDIEFADRNVEALCLQNWDYNCDGKLSRAEAAAVTDLGKVFYMNKNIEQFNELQYFTGLTKISEEAFRQCENLASVTLPASVKVIDKYAFLYCYALAGITLPEGLTTIDISAFGGCNSLENVVFPASLTTLGQSAFSGCAFTSLEIPAGLTDIGRQAFDRIPGLTSIVVDPANPKYDSRDNCNAIVETATNTLIRGCSTTVIPNTVTALSDYAFCGVSGITTLNIPASVKKLGGYAFGECPDLTSAYIPATVDSIGLSLLRVCPKLTSIVVDPANPKYDSRDNCNAIIRTDTNTLMSPCSTTVIPSTVTAIGQEAYSDNTFLVGHFTIPEGITSIGQVAFTGCKGLVSMTLPSTLKEMGILAISFNPALTSVTCLAVTPPTQLVPFLMPFQQEGPDFKIYVPAESVEAYKAADGWKHHASIIFPIP